VSDLADRLRELPGRLAARREAHRVPGASLAVLARDEIVTTAAGLLNVRTGVEATPDAVFQMGSITKVFTTTLVMQLVDERRLALDARVVDLLPGFTLADAGAARRVRIEHLLTHTSGIDGDQFLDTGRGDDAVARFVEACAGMRLLHEPGAMFSYCNAGFVLAGRIVEVLRGAPYRTVLRERLLAPLGLEATGTLAEQAILYRAAVGHGVDLESGAARVVPVWSLQPSNASAGSTPFTTAAELVAFARLHLAGGVTPGGERLLSREAVRAMQARRVTLLPGSIADAWGLGWALADWRGGRVIEHGGVTLGQRAYLAAAPEHGVALALLTNGGDGDSLRAELFDELLGELAGLRLPPPPEPDPRLAVDPARYAGVYERAGSRVTVEAGGAGLAARIEAIFASLDPKAPPIRLEPVAPDLFRLALPDSRRAAFVGFLDPAQEGRPRFLFLKGRAHRRADRPQGATLEASRSCAPK
jgi:CubicO group peptidase (beta-lactamase class C family)